VIYVTSFKSFTLPSEPSRELRILRMLCTLPAAAYLQSTTLHDQRPQLILTSKLYHITSHRQPNMKILWV